ncbi:MAG: hypothetical protein LBK07_08850, partial [Tannerella sp.]|nr:hypothetical protein [Tannerella sp.]
ARHLEGTPGVAVHGPFAPPVGRVQTLYVRHIVLKIERSQSAAAVRTMLEEARERTTQCAAFRQILIYCDVDN